MGCLRGAIGHNSPPIIIKYYYDKK